MAEDHMVVRDGDILEVKYDIAADMAEVGTRDRSVRFSITFPERPDVRSRIVSEAEDSDVRTDLSEEVAPILEILGEAVETDQMAHNLAQLVYKVLGLVVEDSPDAVETPEGWRSDL